MTCCWYWPTLTRSKPAVNMWQHVIFKRQILGTNSVLNYLWSPKRKLEVIDKLRNVKPHELIKTRGGGKTPRTPRSGGLTYAQGPHVTLCCTVACKQTKEKHISRECALKMALTRSIVSPKCSKYRLAAGLRPDLLEELSALPRPPSWI